MNKTSPLNNRKTTKQADADKFLQLTLAKSYANRNMFLKVTGSDNKQRTSSSLRFNFSVESHLWWD